jgi:hypothetical protein
MVSKLPRRCVSVGREGSERHGFVGELQACVVVAQTVPSEFVRGCEAFGHPFDVGNGYVDALELWRQGVAQLMHAAFIEVVQPTGSATEG